MCKCHQLELILEFPNVLFLVVNLLELLERKDFLHEVQFCFHSVERELHMVCFASCVDLWFVKIRNVFYFIGCLEHA